MVFGGMFQAKAKSHKVRNAVLFGAGVGMVAVAVANRRRARDGWAPDAGWEAAPVQRAIDEGDDAERRQLAHGLKGSSATMGASRLQRLCERLGHAPRDADGADDVAHLQLIADEALNAVAEALA